MSKSARVSAEPCRVVGTGPCLPRCRGHRLVYRLAFVVPDRSIPSHARRRSRPMPRALEPHAYDPHAYAMRRTIALTLAVALALDVVATAVPAAAQTAPGCQPGYYYASDGYCYPNAQPTYAVPPPVYDAAPPVYQSPVALDGVAIGVGLGALLGIALSAGGNHGHDRAPARGHAPPRRGGHH